MKSSCSSRRKRACAVLALGLLPATLLVAPTAMAACEVARGFNAQDVQMDMGQVVIPPGLPVGGVIKEIQVPITARSNAIYCDGWFSTDVARGRYVQAAQLGGSTGGNVYPTMVAGVGIRVWREGESVRTYYPHDLLLSGGWSGQWYSLEGGRFIVELVKTAQATGSGPIANNGQFTTYYVANNPGRPVLTSTFKGSGTTIVPPTCEVDAGTRNIAVEFGQVPNSRFTGVGSRADSRDFLIRLTCQGSNASTHQNDISVRLDSSSALRSMPGVIKVAPGADAATAIGVEVVRVSSTAETPVQFGQGLPLGRTRPGSQTFELSLRARYIQTTAGPVRPGVARATATFTIEYD